MSFDDIEIGQKFSHIINGDKQYFRKTGATLAIRLSDEKQMVFYPSDEVELVKN